MTIGNRYKENDDFREIEYAIPVEAICTEVCMTRSNPLRSMLKTSQREVQDYVHALETENRRLHRQIATLEVLKATNNNRVAALKKEMTALAKRNGLTINVNFGDKKKISGPEMKPIE